MPSEVVKKISYKSNKTSNNLDIYENLVLQELKNINNEETFRFSQLLDVDRNDNQSE